MDTKQKFAVGFGGVILLVYFFRYVSLIQLIQLVLLETVLFGIFLYIPWITKTSQIVLPEMTQILVYDNVAKMDTTIKVLIGSGIIRMGLLYMTELPFSQWFILVLFEMVAVTVCYICRPDADTKIKSLVDNTFKIVVMRPIAFGIGIFSLTVFCTANLTGFQRIIIVLVAVVYDTVFSFLTGNRYSNEIIEHVVDIILRMDIDTKASIGVGMVGLSILYFDDVVVSLWNMSNLLMLLALSVAGLCCRFVFNGDIKQMTAVVVSYFNKLDTAMKTFVCMAMATSVLFYVNYMSFLDWISTLLIGITFFNIFKNTVSTGTILQDVLTCTESVDKLKKRRKVSLAIHIFCLSILCTLQASVIQMTTMLLVSIVLVKILNSISWKGTLRKFIEREYINFSSMNNKTKALIGTGFIILVVLYLIEFSLTLLLSTVMTITILSNAVSNINELSLYSWIMSHISRDEKKEETEVFHLYLKRLRISERTEFERKFTIFKENVLMLNTDCKDLGRQNEINPLDLTVAIFKFSTPTSMQILASKLFMCKLAIPLVFPWKMVLSVWPLRCIRFRGVDGHDSTAPNCPCHIISFCRLGRPSLSKSKLLNAILFDNNYNTFFNQDCPHGKTKRRASGGLIEAAWYLPSSQSKIFDNATMLMNLRGDAKFHKERLQFLTKISVVSVYIVGISYLNKNFQNLLGQTTNDRKVLLAIDAKNSKKEIAEKIIHSYLDSTVMDKQTRCVLLSIDGNVRSLPDVRDDMRRELCNLLSAVKTKTMDETLAKCNVSLDEDEIIYKTAKDCAKKIIENIPEAVLDIKECVVPLQEKPWQVWSKLLKKASRQCEDKTVKGDDKIRLEMKEQRDKQVKMCKNIGQPMKMLISNLSKRDEILIFVQFLKLYLDERSERTMSSVLSTYKSDFLALQSFSHTKGKSHYDSLKQAFLMSKHKLAEASFGFEHLCREMGQTFEAIFSSSNPDNDLQFLLKELPQIGAKLLLAGEPLEIIHGETENIPVTWIEAVLYQLQDNIGNKKIMTLSVVGFKGSGKTTLLNTIFGLQLPTFSGRYGGGAFMQLVPVVGKSLPFDYILVVDPEGFQSLEGTLDEDDYDNSLATFVIGLADTVLVNLNYEDSFQRDIVLDIVVHTFLRVKLAHKQFLGVKLAHKEFNLNKRCVFVNQNVSPPEANSTIISRRQELVEKLDSITQQITTEKENVTYMISFNQVIEFESDRDIVFFPPIWNEDSQMATVNPEFSNTLAELKKYILFDLSSKPDTFLTIGYIVRRIHDLWTGILKGNFVSNFRDTLEEEAYIILEKECEIVRWKIIKFGHELVRTEAKCILMNIKKEDKTSKNVSSIFDCLKTKIIQLVERCHKELGCFVEQHPLRHIMANWIKGKQDNMKEISKQIIGHIEKDIEVLENELRSKRIELMHNAEKEEKINEQLALKIKETTHTADKLTEQFEAVWASLRQQFNDIEYYKRTAWMLFHNLVQGKTEEFIAVEFFREAIIQTVVVHVNEMLPLDIEERMRHEYSHSKLGLMKEIMLHLSQTESFEKFEQYIKQPEAFAKSYVMELTSKKMLEIDEKETNDFCKLASKRIREILIQLSTVLSDIMSKHDQTDTIDVWVETFVEHVSEANILPISSYKLIHLRKRGAFDMNEFRRMINEELNEIETQTVAYFKKPDKATVKQIDRTISKLIDKLWGCPEICMFCKEPCKHTDKDHIKHGILHQCIQHRPRGIGSWRYSDTKQLVVEFCNISVDSDKRFRRNDGTYLPYKDYKKEFPNWFIHSSSDSSIYWMWVMCKYREELTNLYHVSLPDIPKAWYAITKEQAIESVMKN